MNLRALNKKKKIRSDNAMTSGRQSGNRECDCCADGYDGHCMLSASRVYQAGRLNDSPGWDHMGSNVAVEVGKCRINVRQ